MNGNRDVHWTRVLARKLAKDTAASHDSLRREAVESLKAARAKAFERLPRALPIEPPASFPEDTLTYLGNVFNEAARRFQAKHCVKMIAPAYQAMEEPGDVSLMITNTACASL